MKILYQTPHLSYARKSKTYPVVKDKAVWLLLPLAVVGILFMCDEAYHLITRKP